MLTQIGEEPLSIAGTIGFHEPVLQSKIEYTKSIQILSFSSVHNFSLILECSWRPHNQQEMKIFYEGRIIHVSKINELEHFVR